MWAPWAWGQNGVPSPEMVDLMEGNAVFRQQCEGRGGREPVGAGAVHVIATLQPGTLLGGAPDV